MLIKAAIKLYFSPMWLHPWLFWGTVIPLTLVNTIIKVFFKEYQERCWYVSLGFLLVSAGVIIWRSRYDWNSPKSSEISEEN